MAEARRLVWLERELERVEALRVTANKDARVHTDKVLELVAAGQQVSAKLRVLSDPGKQYQLHDWRSKCGEDHVLLEMMIAEYQMERDYKLFAWQMEGARAKDRTSTFDVFKDHPERHDEYLKFVIGGGGLTYEEFDMRRCRKISKAHALS